MIWGRCELLGALVMVSAITELDTVRVAARSIDAVTQEA